MELSINGKKKKKNVGFSCCARSVQSCSVSGEMQAGTDGLQWSHTLIDSERERQRKSRETHRAMERERVRHYRNRLKQNPWDYQRYVKRNRQAQRRYREKQEKNKLTMMY